MTDLLDLLARADPAADLAVPDDRLRAEVDRRLAGGAEPLRRPGTAKQRRAWVAAAASFVAVAALLAPLLILRFDSAGGDAQPVTDLVGGADLVELPGIEAAVDIGGGGIRTIAADGDTIWVLSAVMHELVRVDATTNSVVGRYPIEPWAEGVAVGGGYVWLTGLDDGGEVLRFDPEEGAVDLSIPLDADMPPWPKAFWFGDRLWVSAGGVTRQISADGEVLDIQPGDLKGEGLGLLWRVGPDSPDTLQSVDEGGTIGDIAIELGGGPVPDGDEIGLVTEAGGYLWLLSGDDRPGDDVVRVDVGSGEAVPVALPGGLLSMEGSGGVLWVTSITDHVVARVDPETLETTSHPLPGKPGGMVDADGSLWTPLYHPGVLLRTDPEADLFPEAARIVDQTVDGHRLLCTIGGLDGEEVASLRTDPGSYDGPATVILDAQGWIGYGSWSVVQSMLGETGLMTCSHGYVGRDTIPPPDERAADLAEALETTGLDGPYLLVANGDGVHSSRLFAGSGVDVAGMVLVDPMPIGFQTFLDGLVPDLSGHPPWSDLDEATSDALGDIGSAPLTVIGQDPESTYLSPGMRDYAGDALAEEINDAWQDGLAFYASLSTDTRSIVADGSAMERIPWSQPELVVEEIQGIVDRLGPGPSDG
jgi:streptogramin lyase